MFIIVAYLPVSVYAEINAQATVGIASSKDAEYYDIGGGVYTDEGIDRAINNLIEKYGQLPLVYR